ncbi:MAG: hypothetical protein ABF811_04040 [Pseudoclavibacter sp.]
MTHRHFPLTRTLAATAALILVAGLTACASTDAAPKPENCLRAGAASAAVKVDAKTSAAKFSQPLAVSKAQQTVVRAGHGDWIGTQRAISGTIRFFNAKTGDEISSGGDTGAQSFGIIAPAKPTQKDALDVALHSVLTCGRIGQISAMAVPKVQLSSTETAPVVAVVHITKAMPLRAEGRVIETHRGFPAVVRAATGQPGVSTPTVAAPKQLKSQAVIEGSGKKIKTGQKLVAACTAITYSTSSPQLVYSTWDQSTFTAIDTKGSAALKRLAATAFVGTPLGSQVVVIGPYVPGACEDSTSATGTAPATSMIYVFDLLDTL